MADLRWFYHVLVVALMALTAVPSGAFAAGDKGLEESRQELESIQAGIRQAARNLETKNKQERSAAEELETVEQALTTLGEGIQQTTHRLQELSGQLTVARTEVARTGARVQEMDDQVRVRLRALYKRGESGMARVLFNETAPARMAEDYEFFNRIVRRDRLLLQTYREQLALQQKALQRLDLLQTDQEEALAQQRQQRLTVREAVRLKERLLVRVSNDRKAAAEQLTELRQRAERLAVLIKKLESQKSRGYSQKSTFFAGQRGLLPWPAGGRVRVPFGKGRHPELGTPYQSQGIELQVSGKGPAVAVWAGKVVFADRFRGYGDLLIVDHGDGFYTLYAQASRLLRRVGEQLHQGDSVVLPGGEHTDRLYFEIRKGGTPLDPTAWLSPP